MSFWKASVVPVRKVLQRHNQKTDVCEALKLLVSTFVRLLLHFLPELRLSDPLERLVGLGDIVQDNVSERVHLRAGLSFPSIAADWRKQRVHTNAIFFFFIHRVFQQISAEFNLTSQTNEDENNKELHDCC